MFIGHFGVGLAAKSKARPASLGTLLLASQFIDLLWPSLLLLGLERVEIVPGATKLTPLEFVSYPISHSLLTVVGWSILFGVVFYVVKRMVVPAVICGALVASHWVLDALTHKPDLPLVPGGAQRIGLGLWNHPALEITLEVLVFSAGVFLYLRATKARDRVGTIGFWSLVGFLLVAHFGNMFGPPPPSVGAIAWSAQAMWLLVAWGYWVDRHRDLKSA